jgi:hypothetical protein
MRDNGGRRTLRTWYTSISFLYSSPIAYLPIADIPLVLAAPNLNLTPEEKRAYGQLFRQADHDNVGVVTGEIAVKFFDKTRLDSRVLGEVRPTFIFDPYVPPN